MRRPKKEGSGKGCGAAESKLFPRWDFNAHSNHIHPLLIHCYDRGGRIPTNSIGVLVLSIIVVHNNDTLEHRRSRKARRQGEGRSLFFFFDLLIYLIFLDFLLILIFLTFFNFLLIFLIFFWSCSASGSEYVVGSFFLSECNLGVWAQSSFH